LRHFANPRAGTPSQDVLTPAGFEAARDTITSWPGYAPTPLRELAGLAAALGIGRLRYKDESGRFGLASFKALGGAYAVARLAAARDPGRLTVATATDGNHGRAVAWGAERHGSHAVIYVHEKVSEGRCAAIRRFGAEIVRVPGSYDDSVRRCAADAARNGWTVVSDTAWEGYTEIPRDVMHGYGVIADEIADDVGDALPTHLFVQAGVGALAAALEARFAQLWGSRAPRLVVVEPESADACFRSATAGRPMPAAGDLATVMAGLSCGEISPLAWEILRTADDFVALDDSWAVEAMRILADGRHGTEPFAAGETGVAGLAALMAAASDPAMQRALGLGPDASVLVIGSEGATDPEIYERLVGRSADEVGRSSDPAKA
jgi:diaminopropionate ammonia-lyase